MAINDGLANANVSFENVVAQLRIINPKVDLRTEGSSYAYMVAYG